MRHIRTLVFTLLIHTFSAVAMAQQALPNEDEIRRIIAEERARREAELAKPKDPLMEEIQRLSREEALKRDQILKDISRVFLSIPALIKDGKLDQAAEKYEYIMGEARKIETAPEAQVQLIAATKGLVDIRLSQAKNAQKKNRHAEASFIARQVFEFSPENLEVQNFIRANERAEAEYIKRSPSRETSVRGNELLEQKERVKALMQDGRFLYELRDLDEAEEKFREVTKHDPANDQAYNYLRLIGKLRGVDSTLKRDLAFRDRVEMVNQAWIPPTKNKHLPIPNPVVDNPASIAPKGRSGILQKLQSIVIPEMNALDGFSMVEAVNLLDQAVKRNDPSKSGINFIIKPALSKVAPRDVGLPGLAFNRVANDMSSAVSPVAPSVDPGSGLPLVIPPNQVRKPVAKPGLILPPAPADPDVIDPSSVMIRGLTTPLKNLTAAQLLDAITKSFDMPIQYIVEDYAVYFAHRPPEQLEYTTRMFKINPNTFKQGLGVVGPEPKSKGRAGNSSRPAGSMLPGANQVNSLDKVRENSGSKNILEDTASGASIATGGAGGGGGPPGGGGGGPGGGAGGGAGGGGQSNTAAAAQVMQYLQGLGVNVAQVFFNDRNGMLLVRAPLADLELIEQAIEVLNAAPSQVMIEAKFAEIEYNKGKALGFDWMIGQTTMLGGKVINSAGTAPSYIGEPSKNNPSGFFPFPGILQGDQFQPPPWTIPPSASDGHLTRNFKGYGNPLMTVTGILTDPQFRMVISALDNDEGVDLMSAPRVLTVSGRQTSISIQDERNIVTGLQPAFIPGQPGGGIGGGGAGQGGGTMTPTTQAENFGPSLDVIPYVGADGYTIELSLLPQITEFLGYEDSSFEASTFVGSQVVVKQAIPLPRRRTRSLQTQCVVWDGQTLVLGGLLAETVQTQKDKVPYLGDVPFFGRLFRGESTTSKKKNMTIFVTPTIIDPAGNRVNNDDLLPFTRIPVPEMKPMVEPE